MNIPTNGVGVKLVEKGQDMLTWKLGTCARGVLGNTERS